MVFMVCRKEAQSLISVFAKNGIAYTCCREIQIHLLEGFLTFSCFSLRTVPFEVDMVRSKSLCLDLGTLETVISAQFSTSQ